MCSLCTQFLEQEFVVGVCNFTGKDTTKKVEFAFRVFDENDDGYIDVEELCQILRAIHMVRRALFVMCMSPTSCDYEFYRIPVFAGTR